MFIAFGLLLLYITGVFWHCKVSLEVFSPVLIGWIYWIIVLIGKIF